MTDRPHRLMEWLLLLQHAIGLGTAIWLAVAGWSASWEEEKRNFAIATVVLVGCAIVNIMIIYGYYMVRGWKRKRHERNL